jgi:ribosomal protein S18 acetylase RimI-like enzyme
MLVKLYELPEPAPVLAAQRAAGVDIRRALAAEKHLVVGWVRRSFGEGWASECEVAFAREPIACLIAVAAEKLLGFAVYDATARGVFGPIGVEEAARRRGTGAALLIATLATMRAQGYAYAVIGGVGPADWYAKTVGAAVIAESEPGMYRGLLRRLE